MTSRLLLTLDNLVLPVKPDWLFFLYIPDNYHVHVTEFAGIILLHGNNTRMFTCYIYSCYTGVICTSRYWTIVSNVQVFDETVRFARSLGPLLVLLHFLFLLLFLDSCISYLACHSIPVISWSYLLSLSATISLSLSICYHVYVLLQWFDDYYGLDYSLFSLI